MLREMLHELPFFVSAALTLSSSLVLWRLWLIALKPLIQSGEPKELPYWIPCHTFAFFSSSDKLLEYGLNYFGRTRDVFALHMMGKKLYVITDAGDVATAFNNREGLSFDGHLGRLLKNFGVNPEALKRSWHKPQPGDWCYTPNNPINPRQLDLIHFVEETMKTQLSAGEHEEKQCRDFLASASTSLQFGGDGLLDYCTLTSSNSCLWCSNCTHGSGKGGGERRQVALYSLCSQSMVEAITRSFFGQHLHDIDADIVDNMIKFNQHVWMVIFDYGKLFETPVSKPQKSLMAAITKFIQTPPERRSGAAWAIRTMTAAMETVDIDMESRAAMVFMSYWAAVSNEHNLTFWILATLLYNEPLLRLVQQETAAAWKSPSPSTSGSEDDEQLDIKYLCANSPQLDALFYETLRVRNGAGALREVTQQTYIRGKLLKPGNSVMIPFHQLHSNEEVWGQNAHDFDPARFLNKPNLARHPSFRPFGGGATLCPGKLIGKEQAFGFIAILLRRFDIKLATAHGGVVEKQQFLRMNDTTPSLGINGPVGGMDVIVELTARSNSKKEH